MRNYVEKFHTNIDHNLAKKILARYLSYSKIKFCDPPSKRYNLIYKSPYSVRIQENTDQKQLRIWTLFRQCFTTNFYFLVSLYY